MADDENGKSKEPADNKTEKQDGETDAKAEAEQAATGAQPSAQPGAQPGAQPSAQPGAQPGGQSAGQGPVGGTDTTATQPQAGLIAQYIKDLSFENPNAPATFQNMQNRQPNIQVNVDVGARQAGEQAYEVDLKISASSKAEEDTIFVVELVFSGLFGLRNIPQDALQPFLLIQAPHLLFPFARRIIADAVRDGGFPPLMLEPIDFASLYRQQLAQQQQQAGGDAGGQGGGAGNLGGLGGLGDTPTSVN